jgi:hypothetical protein
MTVLRGAAGEVAIDGLELLFLLALTEMWSPGGRGKYFYQGLTLSPAEARLFATDLDHVLERLPAEEDRVDFPDLFEGRHELIRQIADLGRAGAITCEGDTSLLSDEPF